ncbi:uncharacterized protein si:ch211-67e16.11 [Neolamprologus brichardi]|uniref:uncharacterized protein si:ch211-67e16.11 n=1 Tax=Neolamprologus brichardi TaxID=32507 RepID=UPI001643F0B0|nr:uncharacterized protein si:ch211-67e16.11 [Neolamprologus brichardi]
MVSLRAFLLVLMLHTTVVVPAAGVTLSRLERWVRSALQSLQWNQLERCRRLSSLSEAECRQHAHLPLSSVAVYVAEPHSVAGHSDKVLAILPDSSVGMLSSKLRRRFSGSQVLNGMQGPHQQSLPRSMAHDAVLVLDPSPGENFGHPVVLFYVDVNVTKKRCSHLDGIYLGDECLTLALKGRCENQLKHRHTVAERVIGNGRMTVGTITTGGGNRLLERAIGGLCEVHFLPLVVGVRDSNRTQRLRCVDHTDFAACPQLLPMNSPSLPVSSCELNKNTRRCHQQPLGTHLSCRLYQTCDHAVLISDLKERYSVNELLADLAGCRATRVLLFVDQSYSGVLSKRLQGSQKHLNVVLIQNPARQTYAHLNHRLSPGWEDSSWSLISPATCLLDHLGKDAGMFRLLEPWAGLLNVTLAGAPCNATPPLTDSEMQREYQGCQNLPTALWHQKLRRAN